MTNVQNSLSRTEQEIFKSFTDHEIVSVIQQRSESELIKQYNDTIKYCVFTSGIKEMPDEITDGNLYKLITTHYNTHTFNEICKAVLMNSIGELKERHEHYGLFDTTFLSKIMTDYKILKQHTRMRAASLLPPATIKLETNESLYQGLLNYININNAFPVMWAWSKVYQHMDECRMISESNEEKRQIMSQVRAREKVAFELKQLQVADFIERSRLAEEFEEELKVNCRKELIIRRLEYLITPPPNDSANATHD